MEISVGGPTAKNVVTIADWYGGRPGTRTQRIGPNEIV
jgi:hypothetical protein